MVKGRIFCGICMVSVASCGNSVVMRHNSIMSVASCGNSVVRRNNSMVSVATVIL